MKRICPQQHANISKSQFQKNYVYIIEIPRLKSYARKICLTQRNFVFQQPSAAVNWIYETRVKYYVKFGRSEICILAQDGTDMSDGI